MTKEEMQQLRTMIQETVSEEIDKKLDPISETLRAQGEMLKAQGETLKAQAKR